MTIRVTKGGNGRREVAVNHPSPRCPSRPRDPPWLSGRGRPYANRPPPGASRLKPLLQLRPPPALAAVPDRHGNGFALPDQRDEIAP
jgi:hypothetical protein